MNRSKIFLNRVDSIYHTPISDEVANRARQSLLDYISVTCAGSVFQKNKINNSFLFIEPDGGECTAIGLKKKLATKDAVFINGLNSHALDYDDGTNSGIIHLGSPVFSVLIPLAEKFNKTVSDLIDAAVVGYEASYTMAVSIQPQHKTMGYHATGTCGTLGATVAASYLLDFTEEERFQAFAAACVAASGMLKVLDDGSELKPYNVAKAALLSLTALQMAKAGFKGHPDPLGGRGFFKMMTGKEDIDLKPVLLNGTYAIMKSYTKPYASCRYTHPSVEAAIHMRNLVKVEDIESIDVRTYDLAVAGHAHTEIQGSYSAKMSIPYATAVGFLYGKAGIQEFSEDAVRGAEVLDLTRKISVRADERMSSSFPDLQTAVVTIRTKDREYIERVDFPKGEPENPLTDEEFKNRYDGLMEYAKIDPIMSSEVYDLVYSGNETVNTLVEKL